MNDNAQREEQAAMLALDDEQKKYIASLPAKATATQRWVTRMICQLMNLESKRTMNVLIQHRDAIRKERARIDALEAEAAQREYKGTFAEGEVYRKHNSVTFDGSLWIATAERTTKPPPGHGWKLAVRAGRDAR